jgi:O-antigen ligase
MRVHQACAVVAALFLAASVFGHTVSLRMVLLAAGIVLASIAVAKEKDVRALPPIWIPFLLWGAWALLSLTWSIEPERSLKEWRNEVFYSGAGLWVCYVGAQATNAPRVFLTVSGAAIALACTVALYEYTRGREHYMAGWHGGAGDHSSALVTLVSCVAVAAWYGSRSGWPRWSVFALWTVMAMMLASGYATLNRTLWLAFAVQFTLLGGLVLARTPGFSSSRRARLALSACAIAALLGCGVILVNIQAEREAAGGKALETDTRLALWPQVAQYVQARPVVGYGFGRGLLQGDLQDKFKQVDQNLWHAHNLFLEALVQLGVPGLLLLLALLGVLLREGWRRVRQGNEALAACGMALLGVLAGMLVRNMTDTLLVRQNALLFWGVSGVLLAWGSRSWRA